MPSKVLHLNFSSSEGGAARAASRLHFCLQRYAIDLGWESSFRGLNGQSGGSGISVYPAAIQSRIWRKSRPHLVNYRRRKWTTINPVIHSIAWPDTGLGQELETQYKSKKFDILNMHWLGDNTLSVEEIGRLSAPLVCTLHDQWYFLGSEHYVLPQPSSLGNHVKHRFEWGYSKESCPTEEQLCDLNRWTWLRKKRSWQKPFTLVAPSQWMADCAQMSSLMADWPTHVIPNTLDLERWSPLEKPLARKILGLPLTSPIILFGAMGGTNDPRKGGDLLIAALHHLLAKWEQRENLPNLVVFGEQTNSQVLDIGLPAYFLGPLHDDITLQIAYSAADVMVVPSRLDNLPNTATEAMACGTPVVSFCIGGLPEIIDHGINGMLVNPFEVLDLARSINHVIKSPETSTAMAREARKKAKCSWGYERIAALYSSVYNEVIESLS